ncbi:hypothetical protein [Culturomica massiliensis]|jgi:hypothetical protein|uniref:hypothetical protein n=1 Tax=Culturomica massiliensis TaxID=1841857 RepID=UPI002664E3F6|nr:hypothetical protein [Culturomica massiliensis]
MIAAIEHHVNPTTGTPILGKELAAQWTTPELLLSGLSIGVGGWQGITKGAAKIDIKPAENVIKIYTTWY